MRRAVAGPRRPVRQAPSCRGVGSRSYPDDLARLIGTRILCHPAQLDDVARQLDEYFAGQRRTFDLPLDWRLTHGYCSEVFHVLPTITYGNSASYGAVAKMTGQSSAACAVGTACATNPMPSSSVPPSNPRRRRHWWLPRRHRGQSHSAHPRTRRLRTKTQRWGSEILERKLVDLPEADRPAPGRSRHRITVPPARSARPGSERRTIQTCRRKQTRQPSLVPRPKFENTGEHVWCACVKSGMANDGAPDRRRRAAWDERLPVDMCGWEWTARQRRGHRRATWPLADTRKRARQRQVHRAPGLHAEAVVAHEQQSFDAAWMGGTFVRVVAGR